MPQLGDIASVVLREYSKEGKVVDTHSLGDMVAEALKTHDTVLLVFLRRFGCGASRIHARRLARLSGFFLENNCYLIGIGCCLNRYWSFYTKEWKRCAPLVIDELEDGYARCGFGTVGFSNALGLMNEKTAKAALSLIRSFCMSSNLKGEWHQLGGTVVVWKGSDALFVSKELYAGDFLETEKLKSLVKIPNQ